MVEQRLPIVNKYLWTELEQWVPVVAIELRTRMEQQLTMAVAELWTVELEQQQQQLPIAIAELWSKLEHRLSAVTTLVVVVWPAAEQLEPARLQLTAAAAFIQQLEPRL